MHLNLGRLWIVVVYALAAGLPAADETAAEVLKLDGGVHAKFAWIRATQHEPYHGIDPNLAFYGETDGNQLVVLDTKEGNERIFQAGPGCFANPVITRDGAFVIWSDVVHKTSWVADWAGKHPQKLSDGECYFVLSTQWDAATKTEWVYAYDGSTVWATTQALQLEQRDAFGSKNVWRFPLTKGPAAKELVWSKTKINTYWTVSSDGKKAASVFPWPKTGIANLPDKDWVDLNPGGGWGCWACLAPDDSYRFFFFQGNHRKINMFDPGQTTSREIDLTTTPNNLGTHNLTAPRFANDARYVCVESVGEVFLGRFDAGWTKIETWVQISHHEQYEVMLSAWFADGVTHGVADAKKK
jgi:hypothetical protein